MPAEGRCPRHYSKKLDRILGFDIPKLEQKLLQRYRAYYKKTDISNNKKHFENTQAWIGLHPQVLQTPYSEIYHFLSLLQKFKPQKIVDFGAGYGRVGIVMNALYPQASFIGYEIVDIRIKEARRMFKLCGLDNCEIIKQNILDESFVIPSASIYCIYDFSFPEDLEIILKKLSALILTERFFIVAKGDSVQTIIKSKFPEFYANKRFAHGKQWSIFSSFKNNK